MVISNYYFKIILILFRYLNKIIIYSNLRFMSFPKPSLNLVTLLFLNSLYIYKVI